VLTKTKQPELHRYWTQRDRAATRRLFRLLAEVLRAIEAEAFYSVAGWHCRDCSSRGRRGTANERIRLPALRGADRKGMKVTT
jgi:hypothetical protein